MSHKINTLGLSPRQHLVLVKTAEGLNQSQVAKLTGYSREHTNRILRSAAGQAALERLREEIEAQLCRELPELVEKALATLREDLSQPAWSAVRRKTAKFVLLHLGQPFLKESLKSPQTPDETAGEIIEAKSTTYGKETDYEHTNNQG